MLMSDRSDTDEVNALPSLITVLLVLLLLCAGHNIYSQYTSSILTDSVVQEARIVTYILSSSNFPCMIRSDEELKVLLSSN